MLATLRSRCIDFFHRIICNETHKLKSTRIRINRFIQLLKSSILIFLSATLMMNRFLDLLDLLTLLWKDHFALFDVELIIFVRLQLYLSLFRLETFKRYAFDVSEKQMSPSLTNIIISLILTIIQLRGIMIDSVLVLDQHIRIDADISLYFIVTIELQMSHVQTQVYKRIHRRLTQQLKTNSNEDFDERHLNMTINRQLSHAILNFELDKFTTKVIIVIKSINTRHERFSNFEISWYHKHTRVDRHFFLYRQQRDWRCLIPYGFQYLISPRI